MQHDRMFADAAIMRANRTHSDITPNVNRDIKNADWAFPRNYQGVLTYLTDPKPGALRIVQAKTDSQFDLCFAMQCHFTKADYQFHWSFGQYDLKKQVAQFDAYKNGSATYRAFLDHQHHSGPDQVDSRTLTRKSVFYADQAQEVSHQTMSSLLGHARKAGAIVILRGDRHDPNTPRPDQSAFANLQDRFGYIQVGREHRFSHIVPPANQSAKTTPSETQTPKTQPNLTLIKGDRGISY